MRSVQEAPRGGEVLQGSEGTSLPRRLLSGRRRATTVTVAVLVAGFLLWLGLAQGAGRGDPGPVQLGGVDVATISVPPDGADAAEWDAVERVDVVIYGATSSGLGALRGLRLAGDGLAGPVRVALISNTEALESPLAQGLCLEDDYDPGTLGGFYREFRQTMFEHYQALGVWPLERNGRMVYEPEVAQAVLERLAFSDEQVPEEARGRVEVVRLWGVLRAASDAQGDRHVIVQDEGGSRLRLETTYFIDASVEADLARALGCTYTIGRSPLRQNDLRGPRAAPPTRTNLYTTSPQSLTLLMTLQVGTEGTAQPAESHELWRDPAPEPALPATVPRNIASTFSGSWSMRHVLPGDKRELNEAWSDCPDPDLSYSWFMEPESRPLILARLQQRALTQVAKVQDAYPEIGVARLPTWPYVRGEIMVLSDKVFGLVDLESNHEDPISCGKYAAFDRHDTIDGAQQPDDAATVMLPLRAVRPAHHPYLLVSSAYSVDWKAYNSALRMEPVRANAGAACGALTALALGAGSAVSEVEYAVLREELLAQGHVLTR